VKSGLHGLVCLLLEIAALRRILSTHIQLVTPGIRTRLGAAWAGAEEANEQKRTLLAAGSNSSRGKLAGNWPFGFLVEEAAHDGKALALGGKFCVCVADNFHGANIKQRG